MKNAKVSTWSFVLNAMQGIKETNKTLGGARAMIINYHNALEHELNEIPKNHTNKRKQVIAKMMPQDWVEMLRLSTTKANYEILKDSCRYYQSCDKLPLMDGDGALVLDSKGKVQYTEEEYTTKDGNVSTRWKRYAYNDDNLKAGHCRPTYSPWYILQWLNSNTEGLLNEFRMNAGKTGIGMTEEQIIVMNSRLAVEEA